MPCSTMPISLLHVCAYQLPSVAEIYFNPLEFLVLSLQAYVLYHFPNVFLPELLGN